MEAAKGSRTEGLRRIFFLGRAPHQSYPQRPRRNGGGSASTRRCASNRRELSKVEGLVEEESGQGRFRYPAACILRLALTCREHSIRAAKYQREVLDTTHRGAHGFRVNGRQPFPYRIMEGLPVIQPQLTAGLLEPDKGRTAGSALARSSINLNHGIHLKNSECLAGQWLSSSSG